MLQNVVVDGPANVNLAAAAETVVAALPGLTVRAGAQVVIEGTVNVNPVGVGGTSLALRIRRGATAAGAQVGPTVQHSVAAGNAVQLAIRVDDTPGEVDGQQYVLTVVQQAATGAGTAASSNMQATWQQ